MGTVAVETEGRAGSRLESDEPSRPVGAMIRAAKEVNALLSKVDLPPRVTRFLRHLEDLTFGNAGYHQHWGHAAPGSWCHFDLAAWARELELEKSSLLRIRRRLLEEGIIWFEAEETQPGRGRIGWNLVYSEWVPLLGQGRRWGGQRPGAGHPKQQSGIDILKARRLEAQRQTSIDILNGSNQTDIDILNGDKQAGIDILKTPSPGEHSYLESRAKLRGQTRSDTRAGERSIKEKKRRRRENGRKDGPRACLTGPPSAWRPPANAVQRTAWTQPRGRAGGTPPEYRLEEGCGQRSALAQAAPGLSAGLAL